MSQDWQTIIFTEKHKYSFKPEVYIILFGLIISCVAWLITDLQFFGHKSNAIFDIWTLTHIATGAIISFGTILFRGFNIHHPILLLLCISLSWEVIEHYIELYELGVISVWFAGEESIVNRLVSDQIAVVAGFLLIKWRPKLLPFAIITAILILAVHVYLGDSMFFTTSV